MKPSPIFSAPFTRTIACALVALLIGCQDDSIDLLIETSKTVYGKVQTIDYAPNRFYFGDPTPVDLSFRWDTMDPEVKVTKIDFYIQFREPYVDTNNTLRLAIHGGEDGLFLKSWEGASVPGIRQERLLSITQDEIYALFKDVQYDYIGDGRLTPVFNNPAKPERTDKSRFVPNDAFRLTWVFTVNNGVVLQQWPDKVCLNPKESNCELIWSVDCGYGIEKFIGSYTCTEPGYTNYTVSFMPWQATSGYLINDNFWNVGAPVVYRFDRSAKYVEIPEQRFFLEGLPCRVVGLGTIDSCTGNMVVSFAIIRNDGKQDRLILQNTHTFVKNPD
ncbi:MAG: hypothetical protein ACOYW3_04460 [Bacteroidota bacterium]